jgi:ADP-heptose:LPS heptosyltransferase
MCKTTWQQDLTTRTMKENILVIHQGALGDVVLSFPALAVIREERDASLALLCRCQVGGIAQKLNVVDTHFRAESARFCGLFSTEMSPAMKDFINQFDTIIFVGFSDDVENNIRLHHRGQTKKIIPRPPAGEETHVAVHIKRQLEAAGLLEKKNRIRFHTDTACVRPSESHTPRVPSAQITDSRPYIAETKWHINQDACRSVHSAGDPSESPQQKKIFLIHPGAGSQRKRWALDNFLKVADLVRETTPAEIVFLVGPAEKDLLPFIAKTAARSHVNIHHVEDLSKVMALIEASRCFVGNDSGVAHLAGFMGVPTVAVFGPSSPARWSPVGEMVTVLRGASDCAPCFEIEQINCEDPRCLHGVSVDMVVEAIMSVARD